jgi:hypothetical protein
VGTGGPSSVRTPGTAHCGRGLDDKGFQNLRGAEGRGGRDKRGKRRGSEIEDQILEAALREGRGARCQEEGQDQASVVQQSIVQYSTA